MTQPGTLAERKRQYETYVGLHLNIGRIRWQRSAEVAQGIQIALSKGKLPKGYFDAVATHPAQTRVMEFTTNNQREAARMAADSGGPPS